MTATRLRARTVEIDDPGDLIDVLPTPDARVWVRDGEGLVGWGSAVRLAVGAGARRGEVPARLAATLGDIDTDDPLGVPGSGPVAFASLTFDPARQGSVLAVPEVLVGRRHGRAWVTLVARDDDPRLACPAREVGARPAPAVHGRVRYAGSSRAEIDWVAAVAEAVRRIDGGELAKVVLARDRIVWTRAPVDARVLLARLVRRFPACWTFAVDGLVGATPELLVGRDGEEVRSLVLAGSAPRGTGEDDDADVGARLVASGKDRAEHALSVASVRDALAGESLEVRADAEPWLLRLANVQHLATTVRGRLADPAADALTLAQRLHPTAAVCGSPTRDALALVRALERMDRGRYAGPVGWIDARGDGELGIALRCADVAGNRARLFAGAGIVSGSLPEAELEETRLKLRAMQSAFEG